MTLLAFFSPSVPEMLIVLILATFSFVIPIGIGILLWQLLRRNQATASSHFAGDAVFTEAIVGDDGVLRISMSLNSRWASRAVRVVIEPLDRL